MTPLTSAARSTAPTGSAARRRLCAGAALVGCAGLLGGCGATGPAAPIATASMSAAERTAYDGATAAVLAYVQTVADLYTTKRTSLDDLAVVAVPPELDSAQRSIAQARALGYRSEPLGAEVALISAEPYSVELGASPPRVMLKACIDTTDVITIAPTGSRQTGVRQRLEYRVVQAGSLPAGWVVSEVISGRALDRAC